MTPAMQIIMSSKYREFPDTLLTLELCRAMARTERRKIGEALRQCARVKAPEVANKNLRSTLQEMSTSLFPETQITRIRGCIQKMETELTREIGDVEITEENLRELAAIDGRAI
ncbi:DUF7740 domain-containing protein [Phytobacter sp. AG2a]